MTLKEQKKVSAAIVALFVVSDWAGLLTPRVRKCFENLRRAVDML